MTLLSAALMFAACGKVEGDNDHRPECAITYPADGAEIVLNDGLVIRGTFSTPNGSVESATLRYGDNEETGIASSPFVHAVGEELEQGSLTISLEVKDNDGERASCSITVHLVEKLGQSFTDKRDGSQYGIITVGEQVWMSENLRYLPRVDNTFNTYEPRIYVHDYNGTDVNEAKLSPYYDAYGVYYNFYAALDGDTPTIGNEDGGYVQGICPDGWHLPMRKEWQQLHDYVVENNMLALDRGGKPIEEAVGKALSSSDGWQWPENYERGPQDGDIFKDPHLNNATGFNGKPVGFLGSDEVWYHEGESCGWWSSQVHETNDYYSNPTRMWSSDKYFIVCIYTFPTACGFPVRCIHD